MVDHESSSTAKRPEIWCHVCGRGLCPELTEGEGGRLEITPCPTCCPPTPETLCCAYLLRDGVIHHEASCAPRQWGEPLVPRTE